MKIYECPAFPSPLAPLNTQNAIKSRSNTVPTVAATKSQIVFEDFLQYPLGGHKSCADLFEQHREEKTIQEKKIFSNISKNRRRKGLYASSYCSNFFQPRRGQRPQRPRNGSHPQSSSHHSVTHAVSTEWSV
jgi:hypothetical protein